MHSTWPSNSTWARATPGDVLAEMKRLAEEIAARGPVAVALEVRPSQRIPFERMGVPTVRVPVFDFAGLRLETNPDVPPGEVWIRKSDGTVDKIVNVAVDL